MKLAINGGNKVRDNLFPSQNTFTHEEEKAMLDVLWRGILTGYQGNATNFRGGDEVQRLEKAFEREFKVQNAIACNSATSGLYIALAAVKAYKRKSARRKVLVTPYSMTCSATVPLTLGLPVEFIDIERYMYCLDAREIVRSFDGISPRDLPLAIIAVSLFGQVFDPEIMRMARERDIIVIEDAAQAFGARHEGKYAGTIGDIGVFSFNQGKHMTCGEGGMIVTDNDELAHLCRLIMNHAESVLNESEIPDYVPNTLVGLNLRLTEIQAAIAYVQFYKAINCLDKRIKNVEHLVNEISKIPPLQGPVLRSDEKYGHTFYVLPFTWNKLESDGIDRNRYIDAVRAELSPVKGRESEGVPIRAGYIKPIYRMPVFDIRYPICPTCEIVQDEELVLLHRFFGPLANKDSLANIIEAFHKVWGLRDEIREFQNK